MSADKREQRGGKLGSDSRVYVLPCDRPEFRQCLDRSRPFRLLNVDHNGRPYLLPPAKRHQLRYEYTDTGEVVLVPNAHYNQTDAVLAEGLRWQAAEKERRAERMRANPPVGLTAWAVENISHRMLANAQRIREVADGIEAGTLAWDAPFNLEPEDPPSRTAMREAEGKAQGEACAPAAAGSTVGSSRKPPRP